MKRVMSQHAPDCVSGTRNQMYAIHATFDRVKRISEDCSSSECAAVDSNQLSVLLAPSITTGTTISVAIGVEPIYAGDQSQHPVPHATH